MYGRLALRLLAPALLFALGVGCQVDLPLAGGRADPTEGLDLDGGADAAKRLAGDGAGGAEPAPGGAPAEDDPWGDPEEPLVGAEPLPRMEGVEPGVYATDRRWPAFARGWPGRVERALERLGVITGLEFAASGVPRVVLRPFGDETRTHELRAEILTGRRRSVVHVNIEPLLARVHDADRVLLRALAEAAFQDAGRRHGPVPPWFVRMAATVAAGDLEARLTALRRRALREGAEAVVVDPEDATTAEATGLAALVLLADRLGPADMRRAILFVADGDQAGSVLGRLVREADGSWQRPARLALGARLAAIDTAPWELLGRAREAAAEVGRSGVEAVLPDAVPAEIADEILVVRARAAQAEGDHAVARAALRALSPEAAANLQDPGSALALRIDVESRPGGDSAAARRLALQLDRDFPRHEARTRLRGAHPLLGMQEDPQRWLEVMRDRVQAEGLEPLDLSTLERYLRMLVMDHRAGAAASVLADLGARAAAPELENVAGLVRHAQGDPSGAAEARGASRVQAWVAAGTEASERDVRETGRAAGPALLALLAADSARARAEAVRLLAITRGESEAVAAVRALWPGDPARVQRDLFSLASAVEYPALEDVLDGEALGEPEAQALTKGWERLTLGLSRAWLTKHPRFLTALRHESFALRRDAFVQIGLEDPRAATPALVAFGLKDRAALLRREAAVLAGLTGFHALALRALEDPAWLVREEAVRSIARIDGQGSVAVLAIRLAEDPSREVRAAAAMGLVRAAAESPRAIDALLASQVAEEARLRDAIGARLAELPAAPVVHGIVRGWRRALKRTEPSRGYLFRTALLYGRLTGVSLGFYPGATTAELAGMLASMETWLTREAARAAEDAAEPVGRTPAGRGR